MELKINQRDVKAVLIHLTDTYFIQEVRVGSQIELPGFARIDSLINKVKKIVGDKKTLVLHSGDFLFPSYMSKFFDGKQIVEIFNSCGFDYITLGNHDFDGGLSILKKRLAEAKFKTILTNLKPPKKFPVKCPSHVLWPKQKPILAILGLAGLSTQNAAKENGFSTLDVYDSLIGKIKFLRKHKPGIALVVLSHMSNSEDEKLSRWLSLNWLGFSYIFGGHDHNSLISCKPKTSNSILIKSQSNGRTVRLYPIIPSKNNPKKTKNLAKELKDNLITINAKDFQKFPPSKLIAGKIQKWEDRLLKIAPEKPEIIRTFPKRITFDATELSLRKGSTNFGNFITDCLCAATKSDIALINSGHFRGDRRLSNIISASDLRRIFVMDDPGSILKIKLTPKECILLLLHGYKKSGKGRILQMSKNCVKIIKKSKDSAKLNVAIMTDMVFTDDDGFAKILANERKISVPQLRKSLEIFKINQRLIDIIRKQAKFVKYDYSQRFSLKDISK